MKSFFQKFKVPTIIVGILIVSFIIFKAFFSSSDNSSDVLTAANTSTSTVGADFVTQLQQLQQITLDPSVFSDPVFQSLQDFSQPLPNIAVGRDNPFAAVSGLDASAEYSSTSSSDGSNALQFSSASTSASSSSNTSSSQ
jgi:uncharacterized membrane protein